MKVWEPPFAPDDGMINKQAYERGVKPSCIRELFHWGRTVAEQQGESAICDFTLGNPATPPPKEVLNAFIHLSQSDNPKALHGYTVAAGNKAVREKIAQNLNNRFGAGVGAEHLFLTAGACPALVAVFGALTVSIQTEFIAITPYFPEYTVLSGVGGASLRTVPCREEDFQIDLAALEKAITPHTQGVIVNSPNNPSGVIYSRETLGELAKILTRKSREVGHPIYIISDEPYRELVYEGKTVPYIPHIYPDTVICYSYSKSLSLPGDRIGYVLVPPSVGEGEMLMHAVHGFARSSGHVCAPALLQQVVGLCSDVMPSLDAYRENRDTLYSALTAMGYACVCPEGAFYLFVKAPEGDGNAFSQRAKEKNLLVVPGGDFGCPGYVRIAYCVDGETVKRSLPIFKSLFDR